MYIFSVGEVKDSVIFPPFYFFLLQKLHEPAHSPLALSLAHPSTRGVGEEKRASSKCVVFAN
jgi:hypothetical protein